MRVSRLFSFVIHFQQVECSLHIFLIDAAAVSCVHLCMFRQRVLVIFLPRKSKKEKKKVRVPTSADKEPESPPIFYFVFVIINSPAVHIQLTAQPVLLSIYDNDGQCYNSVALLLYIGYTYIFAIAAGRDGDHRVYPSRCNNNPPLKKKLYTIT